MEYSNLRMYVEIENGIFSHFHLLDPNDVADDPRALKPSPDGFCGVIGQSIDDFTDDLQPTEATMRRMKTIEILSARRAAYREESDPLFFGAARGENTEEEWLAKVAEIKMRFPKP